MTFAIQKLILIHFIRCHFCGFSEIHFQIHPHAIWCYASHNLALLWFLRIPILISTIWSYASHNQALLWLFWNPLLNLPTTWSYVFNNMPLLWPFLYIHFSSVPSTYLLFWSYASNNMPLLWLFRPALVRRT